MNKQWASPQTPGYHIASNALDWANVSKGTANEDEHSLVKWVCFAVLMFTQITKG